MSMFLELSTRMIGYLPEEVSKIQRAIELALGESQNEDEMFNLVMKNLSTKHLQEGAKNYWDVYSNASDYAEPLTEGFGGFPIDRSNVQKNSPKDRNIGRVFDVDGVQVLAINKRTSGEYVMLTKDGKRMVKKGDSIGATRTEKVELNLLDVIEEDQSASESPNATNTPQGTAKKTTKSKVIINPSTSDLMKEAKKENNKKKKEPRWQDSDGDGTWYEPGEDVKKEGYINDESVLDEGKNKEGKEQGVDGKACWKGYKYAGTENGKDKCKPMEEYVDLERDMLVEGYTFDQVLEVIEALENGNEVIFEENSYSILGEETVDLTEEEFLQDVEVLADWLQSEGVIENEDQFFELMEDLSEDAIEEMYDIAMHEATAMAKRGLNEPAIRNQIAQSTGGGTSADRATALASKKTYGASGTNPQARAKLAATQRGDFRNTNSSNPGLHVGQHNSNDPAVKAKQAARGAQRGSATLTPNERKNLNMGYEMIGDSLENGGMEVTTYSWRQVIESQEARNNPEKYEAGENKKTAPVRGEKTPMPPRGNKKREDFEKWYAANVR